MAADRLAGIASHLPSAPLSVDLRRELKELISIDLGATVGDAVDALGRRHKALLVGHLSSSLEPDMGNHSWLNCCNRNCISQFLYDVNEGMNSWPLLP